MHATAGGVFRGAPVAIAATEITTIDVVAAARLADRSVIVAITIEALATVAIEIAVATRLTDRAVASHFVPWAITRCTWPTIIGIATIPHLVARAQLRGARRTTGRAMTHGPLGIRPRYRAQQHRSCNGNIPRHPSSPLSLATRQQEACSRVPVRARNLPAFSFYSSARSLCVQNAADEKPEIRVPMLACFGNGLKRDPRPATEFPR